MQKKSNIPDTLDVLRRRAEALLRHQRKCQRSKAAEQNSAADNMRVLHELEVHQIELEMQNAELQKVRNELERALVKYTDLYDFAPVGYFSIDKSGRILEANLTGAALLGIERSRLINQRLQTFVAPANQAIFLGFLERLFAETGTLVCEANLLKKDAAAFWASVHGTCTTSASGSRKWGRVAISDITPLKRAEQVQRRLDTLKIANKELQGEIIQRKAVEESLRKSEQRSSGFLEQLRMLSRQLLVAQEQERKKISRELHDVIGQALTSINVRLANLIKETTSNPESLGRNLAYTQRLVEQSVEIVHRFARELRPSVLDDLGLIPALHTFMKRFKEQTGIHVSLLVPAAVERLNIDKRTVLFRVAQEALTNVARHAQADRIEVRIHRRDDAICMEIKDNGKGFPAQALLHAKRNQRLGLLGMRERLEMLGGNFNIKSAPGKGTTVLAVLPLIEPARGGG